MSHLPAPEASGRPTPDVAPWPHGPLGRPHVHLARRRGLAPAVTFVVAGVGGWASGRSWTRMDMRGRMGAMRGMETAAGNEPRVVAALVGVAALLAVGVWASRTRPRAAHVAVLALTAVYLVLNGPVPTALPAPAFALAALMRGRPQREWLGWATLLLPTFVAPAITSELGFADPALPVLVLVGVAWVILPSLAIQLAGARRAAFAAHREDELRRVAYEERLRVARDIHDVVGHSLSMISLQSGVALHVLDSDPAQVRASLEAIRDASRGSLAELRTTLGVFRQPEEGGPLVPTPSLDGVPSLVESVRAGGRTVGLVMPAGVGDGVPAAVQSVAYRVVQEGLTNAVRHAPGASVAVSVERRDGALVVGVRDDGPARRAPAEGNGLRGMRERASALGGSVTVGVRDGGGLAVEATLPIGGAS